MLTKTPSAANLKIGFGEGAKPYSAKNTFRPMTEISKEDIHQTTLDQEGYLADQNASRSISNKLKSGKLSEKQLLLT